jgi:hypothetical protein
MTTEERQKRIAEIEERLEIDVKMKVKYANWFIEQNEQRQKLYKATYEAKCKSVDALLEELMKLLQED